MLVQDLNFKTKYFIFLIDYFIKFTKTMVLINQNIIKYIYAFKCNTDCFALISNHFNLFLKFKIFVVNYGLIIKSLCKIRKKRFKGDFNLGLKCHGRKC